MCVYTHVFTKTKAARLKQMLKEDIVGAEYDHPKDGPWRFLRFIYRKQPS